MQEITLADRQKAKRIIEDLRRDYETRRIAELFGVQRLYVTYAQNMNKRKELFQCPKWVITKILSYGALLGSRRIKYDD